MDPNGSYFLSELYSLSTLVISLCRGVRRVTDVRHSTVTRNGGIYTNGVQTDPDTGSVLFIVIVIL